MIFTITAQCSSKGMITHSVVRLYGIKGTLRKSEIWASFHIPRQLQHSKTNEQIIRVQCKTINKDKNPESKNRLKIKSKITSYHCKTKTVRLSNQRVITREDNISLKVFHSLHRLMLGC